MYIYPLQRPPSSSSLPPLLACPGLDQFADYGKMAFLTQKGHLSVVHELIQAVASKDEVTDNGRTYEAGHTKLSFLVSSVWEGGWEREREKERKKERKGERGSISSTEKLCVRRAFAL